MSNANLQMRDYNFFSAAVVSNRSFRRKVIIWIVIAVLYLLSVAGGYFMIELAVNKGKDKLNEYDQYLQSEETVQKMQLVADKKLQIDKLNQYTQSLDAFIKQLHGKATISSSYIVQIMSAIPQDLYFDNITMTYNQLQIQGTAPDRIKIAEFLNNMQELELFQDVHISSINAATTGTEQDNDAAESFTFTMSCQLKEVVIE